MSKRSINPLLLVGGGIAIAYGVSYLAKKTGEVIKERIKVGAPKASNFAVNGSGASFKLSFPLNNDLPFYLPENSFIGQLVLSNKTLATVNYPAVAVASGEMRTITTDVEISFLNLASNIIDIIQNPSSLFNGMKVRGNFVSNGVPFSIDEKIKLI